MSPNRPSHDDGNDDALTVRVSRELDAGGAETGVKLTLHPCRSGEPPSGSMVDEATCEQLRGEILDAFDADSVRDLRTVGSDRFARNLCLGTAVIEPDDVEFEANDALRTDRPVTVR